jgi:hypothetical protein
MFVRHRLASIPTRAQQRAPGRTTRFQHLLVAPMRRLAKARKSLDVIGIKLYNSLPTELKNSSTNAIFRGNLKKILLDMACYTIDEFHDKYH